ncbi:MAG TPA: response regulator transcription factor [Chitinophagaceae bacterium]
MSKEVTQIALVDDHSLLRGSLASLINSFEGFSVSFEADNGKDFIAQLQKFPAPDIVLLDITMPEMNGFETAAWIKTHMPSIRVLVLSMMDNETAIISMLKNGVRGYILKDSKPAVFKQALIDIRDIGFFINDLVSNKMLSYISGNRQEDQSGIISELSSNERIFLVHCCSDLAYKEIAIEMRLSTRTIEGYRDDLFKKLDINSRVGLALFAVKYGLYKL